MVLCAGVALWGSAVAAGKSPDAVAVACWGTALAGIGLVGVGRGKFMSSVCFRGIADLTRRGLWCRDPGRQMTVAQARR